MFFFFVVLCGCCRKHQVLSFGGGGGGKAGGFRKQLVIMDEVDGMGGSDRGGIQELILLIKKSRVPIICICNDRQHQKIRRVKFVSHPDGQAAPGLQPAGGGGGCLRAVSKLLSRTPKEQDLTLTFPCE